MLAEQPVSTSKMQLRCWGLISYNLSLHGKTQMEHKTRCNESDQFTNISGLDLQVGTLISFQPPLCSQGDTSSKSMWSTASVLFWHESCLAHPEFFAAESPIRLCHAFLCADFLFCDSGAGQGVGERAGGQAR